MYPDWPAPENVQAVFTTRIGGYSSQHFANLNLGLHVNDNADQVKQNRLLLEESLKLPAPPVYLNQVHKTDVVCAADFIDSPDTPEADACWSADADQVIAIMTADCLPVLFTSRCGSVVAGAHAGWRGLVDGVLQQTISSLPVEPNELIAWLGPAIGPAHFEVGAEVRESFINKCKNNEKHFVPAIAPGKYFADLFKLAEDSLINTGVGAVYGGGLCTYADAKRFYSYRRDAGQTGRMAALIWKTR